MKRKSWTIKGDGKTLGTIYDENLLHKIIYGGLHNYRRSSVVDNEIRRTIWRFEWGNHV